MWPSAVLRPAVSTLFSRRSWLPVLSTDERKDDFASTSLENSCQRQTNKQKSTTKVIIGYLVLFVLLTDHRTDQESVEVVSDCFQLLRHRH